MKNANDRDNCGCSGSTDTEKVNTEKVNTEKVNTEKVNTEKSLQPKSLLASDSITYGYDSRGRLHTVTYQNGTVITYNYDACGNRTSVVTTCPGGTC